jgi:tRNA pseudouridine65 synthase
LNLEILYHDEYLIAINKPHGLLVHRSPIASDASVFAIQELRNQIGQRVYPAHRLDRKTSGVLLFALDKNSDSKIQQMFAAGSMSKSYLAIVRGYTPVAGTIDYPLKKENGTIQEAVTHYKTLAKAEIELALGKHATSRYSLIEAKPETGRMHQLRRHFAHIFHPIIGDRPHGCNKQNKLFKEKFNMTKMMLHASELKFVHPIRNTLVHIKAAPHSEFIRMADLMGWNL